MLEIRMLGPVEALSDGHPADIAGTSQRTILACLGLAGGGVVSADALAQALWGEDAPASASGTVQAYISRLRRSLGAGSIETRAGGYALKEASTDVARFEELAGASDLESCERALGLWRGDVFAGLGDHEPLHSEAIRLTELRLNVEERRGELLIAVDPERAAAELGRLAQREPLRERRWSLLARALAAAGRRPEAIRALDEAREILVEVGLEPSHSFETLLDELVAGAAAPAPPFPRRTTPLIGRNRECEEVRSLLTSHRVVTLVGPGGVGKTSLAQVTAAHHADDVRWCELAPHRRPDSVVPAVAAALATPLMGELEDAITGYLRNRTLLLVLDNCEHLVDETARLVERIVSFCPGVTVLATSREPLGVPAERVLTVRPLSSPEVAAELFLDRAIAAGLSRDSLDPSGVREICAMVDGLPLAIEMAAARVRSLGLAELERRLSASLSVLRSPSRTGGARHSTLESVVDWSVGLLEPRRRLALGRAAVFAGGFDLAAAEAVIGSDPLTPPEVADLLGDLVERSLLVAEHGRDGLRYSMLETIRRVVFPGGRAWADDPAGRHAAHYAALAEEVGRHILGPEEAQWAQRASAELANFRAAVLESLDRADPGPAVRICAGLHQFAYQRLRSDVTDWATEVFPVAEGSGVPGLAVVAASAAVDAVQRGDLDAASEWCHRGRAAAGEEAELLDLWEIECDITSYRGRYQEAMALAGRSASVAERANRPASAAMALANLAMCHAYTGDFEGATGALEEMRRVAARTGSDTIAAWTLYVEGEILLDRDPERAAGALERAVERSRRTGAAFAEGVAGVSWASLAARHGDPEAARVRFIETVERWRSLGDWVHQWVTLRNLAVLLERLDDAEGAALVLSAVADRGPGAHGQEAEMLRRLESSLRSRLGDEGHRLLAERGRALDDDAVVELALARLAGGDAPMTLLMTDIVGSTGIAEAIGDEAWTALMSWHDRMLQDRISRHRGRVVDRAGDGVLAVFAVAADAVACAVDIQRDLRRHRADAGFAPRLRIGVRTGSVHLVDGLVRGLDVHVTARLTDAAEADEILVSPPPPLAIERALTIRGVSTPVAVASVEWE